MKKLLLFVFTIGVIFGFSYFLSKKEVVAPEIVSGVKKYDSAKENSKPTELCFAKFGVPNKSGFYDKYTLRLILDGSTAKGELNFLPAEKDRKTGEISGTVSAVDKIMMARTADLWWFNFAEGMSAQEQVKIIFGEGVASVGFGEMVDRGDGVYVYKDPKNIKYNLELKDVACSDLTERVNIENYLHDNISELSPVKAVLGGTWYVLSVIIDVNKNSGTVVYEDGHIQEKKTFTYTTNETGEVLSLSIK